MEIKEKHKIVVIHFIGPPAFLSRQRKCKELPQAKVLLKLGLGAAFTPH